jgi:uncharacterized protein YkwD
MLLAALVTTALLVFCTPAADAGVRARMVKTINFVRGASHIRGLGYSQRLARSATAWARHLIAANMLAHSHRAQGEVIEWHTGTRTQVKNVVLEWLNSPEHRAVMLERGFRRAGAGMAIGRMGGQWATIWVVQFSY